MKKYPPGPIGGYKKGGRPVKPRIAKERVPRKKIERPWLKLFPTTTKVDWSRHEPAKTTVLYAGRTVRLRNRLRTHAMWDRLKEAPDMDRRSFEIWIWKEPKRGIEETLRSKKPDLKLDIGAFREFPDEPAVYVIVSKPRKA